MTEHTTVEDLDLSDAELLELLRNHGLDRRSVMKVLGLGSALTLGAGTAAGAEHGGSHPSQIDPLYGYASPEDEDLPPELRPDHTVAGLIGEPPIQFYFAPMGLHIDVGDIVRFDCPTPDHTMTAYHLGHGRQQRVPDAEEPFSSPVISIGGFWLFQFDHPGTYDIYCAPHEIFGMVMRIVVGDPDSAGYDGEFSREGRPPLQRGQLEGLPGVSEWMLPTPAEIFETGAMSVRNIVENGPVSRSDVIEDVRAMLDVEVDCDVSNPARVTITNVSGRRVQLRDIDHEGVNAVVGRPMLDPGESYTRDGVESGTAVLAAFDRESDTRLGTVRAEIDCG
jgi:plastocyanin